MTRFVPKSNLVALRNIDNITSSHCDFTHTKCVLCSVCCASEAEMTVVVFWAAVCGTDSMTVKGSSGSPQRHAFLASMRMETKKAEFVRHKQECYCHIGHLYGLYLY